MLSLKRLNNTLLLPFNNNFMRYLLIGIPLKPLGCTFVLSLFGGVRLKARSFSPLRFNQLLCAWNLKRNQNKTSNTYCIHNTSVPIFPNYSFGMAGVSLSAYTLISNALIAFFITAIDGHYGITRKTKERKLIFYHENHDLSITRINR